MIIQVQAVMNINIAHSRIKLNIITINYKCRYPYFHSALSLLLYIIKLNSAKPYS